MTQPRILPHFLARAKAVILLASGAPLRPGEPGPEEVDHLGVDHVAQAALEAGVGRVLLLSRIGASRRFGSARRPTGASGPPDRRFGSARQALRVRPTGASGC